MARIANVWLEHQRWRWMRLTADRWQQRRAASSLFERRGQYRSLYDRKTDAAATPASRHDDDRLVVAIRRAESHIAAARVELALKRLAELCRKAGFNPNQPRVPAGSSNDGQWSDGGGAGSGSTGELDAPIRLASAEDRPPPPGTAYRIAAQLAFRLIRDYREDDNLLDLFDSDEGSTVAVTRFNDKLIFGVNSDILEYSTVYTPQDESAAMQLRDTMLPKYPDKMSLENIGRAPNDALFHAEVTVLLRAARENGGTLKDKSLVVFVDKTMCPSCRKLLPSIGMEIGNPTVTFVNRQGVRKTMRDGDWDPE